MSEIRQPLNLPFEFQQRFQMAHFAIATLRHEYGEAFVQDMLLNITGQMEESELKAEHYQAVIDYAAEVGSPTHVPGL
jgi:hypothetical protein